MASPQVLVRFTAGDHCLFDMEDGRDEYTALLRELNESTYNDPWMPIGKTALIKKDVIERIFYFEQGYAHAQSSQSNVSQA